MNIEVKDELKSIMKIIDDNDIVSFDVFDTLLLRNVLNPTDIFLILEEKFKDEYNIDNFFNIRIEAEKESRIGNKNNETNYDNIYKVIGKRINNVKKIKDEELKLEEKFLVVNPFMKQVYDYAKKKKKKVIAISDMYLPKEFITKILKNIGYELDKIYVSSDSFDIKGNGSLFKKVAEENSFTYNKWVHIGDNYVSDYEMPMELGINSYHYIKLLDRSKYINNSGTYQESILKAIQQNNLYTSDKYDYWEKFGIKCCAPIYYGFTNWIYNLTKDEDNVYFLARDGYIVKKIYDKILNKLESKIDTYYLHCSRRALQIPALYYDKKDEVLKILTRYNADLDNKVLVSDILSLLDLSDVDYKESLLYFGLDLNTVLDAENVSMVRSFLSYIFDDVKNSLKKKKELVVKFLKQNKLDKYDKVNVIDIGWAGSSQYAMKKLLDKNEIYGYYLGTREEMYDSIKETSYGYLFDSEKPSDIWQTVIDNVMMFEFIFSSHEGSTLEYKYNDKTKLIEEVLDSDSINSKIIKKFQESALKICDEYLYYYDELKNMPKYIDLEFYSEFLSKKDFNDIKMFSTIRENLSIEKEKMNFIPTLTEEYIEKNLMESYEIIRHSAWKNAFFVEDISKQDYEKLIKHIFSKKIKIKYTIKKLGLKEILLHPKYYLKKIMKKL